MDVSDKLQLEYYSQTAAVYDRTHVLPGDEHSAALRFISSIASLLGARTILDVGTGTGRGLEFLRNEGFAMVEGLDPSIDLVRYAVTQKFLPRHAFVLGRGEWLPFKAGAFDVVCELGALHHAKDPNSIVQEMIRVARKAVFLSDSNRFGQGTKPLRVFKLLLAKSHFWPVVNLLWTRGKGYMVSENDGVHYSYSVYDSFDILARWATSVIAIPTRSDAHRSWFHPLLSSGHVLLCAIRNA